MSTQYTEYLQSSMNLANTLFGNMVTTQAFKLNIPFESIGLGNIVKNQEVNLQLPKMLLYLAGASCTLHLFRQLRRITFGTLTYFRSWFNAKRYLIPIADKYPNDDRLQTESGHKPRSYAVIYGASNKAGKSYAYFLSSQGFNLILIDRDSKSLQELEDHIRTKQQVVDTQIVRVVLQKKFDEESINKAIGMHINKPVKIFVNCRSSKKTSQKKEISAEEKEKRKKAILKNSLENINDAEINKIIEQDDEIENFEAATRAEVHYTGKEAIEGFAALVNSFLKSMIFTSKTPSLVNVINNNGIKNKKLQDGQLFYHATQKFKIAFTNGLDKKIPDLKAINVSTNFNLIKDNDIDIRAANILGNQTFAYIGLKKHICVKI